MAAAIMAAIYAKDAARHTKAGADEARRAADAAHLVQRPWLDFEMTIKGFCLIQGKVDVRAILTIKNVGSAPAASMRLHYVAYIVTPQPFDDGPMWLDRAFKKRDREIQSGVDAAVNRLRSKTRRLRGLFPGEADETYESFYMEGQYRDGLSFGYAVVAINYDFPGGKGETVKVFHIRYIDIQNTDEHPARATHSEVDIKLQSWPQFGHIS